MVKIIMHILFVIILACFSEGILAKRSSLLHADAWRSTMENAPCHFGLTDPFGGLLKNSSGSLNQWQAYYVVDLKKNQHKEEFAINFMCTKEESFEEICGKMGVKLNNGKWSIAPDFKSSPKEHPIIRSLDKKNARGVFYIFSYLGVPVEARQRTLNFCLTSGNGWTLRGHAIVDHAPYSPRKSTEAEAIRLIKSIRFISPPASGASPSSTPR